MGLIIGGVSVRDLVLDGSSVSLYVGGSPPVRVWPTGKPVVQITLGTALEARNQLRAALADRGLDYQTVTEIPFEIDLVGSGSTRSMFNGCAALTTVPPMDTSDVTGMGTMFYNCSALTAVPPMDTSQVTAMNSMFRYCSSLTHVPDMDTSQVTTMANMFQGCASLTHAPAMDTSSATNMSYMFEDCSALTHVPDLETAQVTNMNYMFRYCSSLTDGNVRLIGRHPNVTTSYMIAVSGLTREPFYDTNGNPI